MSDEKQAKAADSATSGPRPDHIEQFFAYEHLKEPLQAISKPFCELARWTVENVPRNPERTVALRKLRAFLAKDG
jgi:hypothetical protein